MTKRKPPLPPLIARLPGGTFTWQRLESIDYELLGFFLSSHLIIEHYLDELLIARHPELDWDTSRLTFYQKTSLLSQFQLSDKYAKYFSMPAIRHLNSLRNKLSHNIGFKITVKDLQPITEYLKKALAKEKVETPIPTEPKGILELFVMTTCAFLAGYISSNYEVRPLLGAALRLGLPQRQTSGHGALHEKPTQIPHTRRLRTERHDQD
jgi:hypothetical protein